MGLLLVVPLVIRVHQHQGLVGLLDLVRGRRIRVDLCLVGKLVLCRQHQWEALTATHPWAWAVPDKWDQVASQDQNAHLWVTIPWVQVDLAVCLVALVVCLVDLVVCLVDQVVLPLIPVLEVHRQVVSIKIRL